METWKQFRETPYEVSSLGAVRNAGTSTSVKPYWQGKYLAFTVHESGRRQAIRLHVAVLETFCGRRPEGMVGAHLDGDPANCRLDNLAWTTPSENEAHKLAHGTDARGEKSTQARFTNSEADLVRKAHQLGLTLVDLARLTKVNVSTIHRIVTGEKYAA